MIYDNKEEVLSLLRSGYSFDIASDRLRNDKDTVIEAVKIDGWNLKWVSENLKDDRKVVREAINIKK